MNLSLTELTHEDERRLQEFFQSRGFDRLLKSLQAEYFYEVHQIKVGLVEMALDPDSKLDRGELTKAARLKITLEMLTEFCNPTRTHYDLNCDL